MRNLTTSTGLTPEDVNKLHPEGWVPVRRFGVWQSSGDKVKLRPIDDYAENRVNGAYGYSDKLDLRTLDQMIWLCSAIARINDTGRVLLQLQDGTILDGVQHSDWKSGGKGEMMLCVLDLSNAYKQLPLSPSCRKYSIVTLVNPNTGEPACFEGKVLPFGSTQQVSCTLIGVRDLSSALVGISTSCGAIISMTFQFCLLQA